MPEASVVIATRNRAALLENCLAGLARQSARGRFDVVVVDNGSSDETPAVLARAAARGEPVTAVNVAYPNRAKARNAGIARALGDTIVFCDDDTLAPEGFIAAHVRAQACNARSVVSGPIVNVPDAVHLAAPKARHYSRAFLCTCNASVKRDDLLAVGGFDEHYDLYGWEDTDLGVRLKSAGVRRAWSWDAFLFHIKPRESLTLERRIALAREKGAMAARFVRKSPSLQVRLATGAYAANYARAALFETPFLLRWYERVARNGANADVPRSALSAFAAEALVDAAYVRALRHGLRGGG